MTRKGNSDIRAEVRDGLARVPKLVQNNGIQVAVAHLRLLDEHHRADFANLPLNREILAAVAV